MQNDGLMWQANNYKGSERRFYKRIKKNFTANFKERFSANCDIVTMQNLGAGGAMFYYTKQLRLGSGVELKLNFPVLREPVKCTGKVVRTQNVRDSKLYSTAVKFDDIGIQEKKVINTTVERLYARHPELIDM